MTHTVVGSPSTCAEQIEEFVTYCELDGLMLIFPDYVEGPDHVRRRHPAGPAGGLFVNAMSRHLGAWPAGSRRSARRCW
jgi:hypothetical protein